MNWDDVSDFEINKAVAGTKGLFWHCKPSSLQNNECAWIYSDNYCDCDTSNGSVAVELPDYCNSWADMGPLIFDNGISLMMLEGEEEWEASLIAVDEITQETFSRFIFFHINPLRAAAIVFLMMHGVKPEDLTGDIK